MSINLRADRALFRFSGPDAHRLINDVVTGRIPSEPGAPAASWALLSPQGKILAEGLAALAEGALWLDVHQTVADDFAKRMRMYRLRAQVVIDDLRPTHRVGFSTAAQGDLCFAYQDGPARLGYHVIAPVADTATWDSDDAPYHRTRIAAGVLHQGNDFAPNDVFAHDIAFDILDGIDFAKGCYVGQEVVSRMKHRGTARRRPVIVSDIVGAPAGTAVVADGRDAGTIGQVVDGKAIAIVRLDRVTDVNAATVDGHRVTLRLPDWATYRFGEPLDNDAETPA